MSRTVTITRTADGLVASWPSFTMRFLLDDGRTLDVVTQHNTSDLRAAVLKHTGAERIVGHTVLPDVQRLDLLDEMTADGLRLRRCGMSQEASAANSGRDESHEEVA